MAYTSTSKFVQLTPYLLMEYMYADQPTPESYFTNSGGQTVGYNKLINGYQSDSVQNFNPTADASITNNTTLNSVVKIAVNSFVTLDSNLIIPFNDYSDELTNTSSLPVVFPSNLSVVYDTVRYHVRAGYNLQNIDGIVVGIDFQDSNLNFVTMSQIFIQKGTDQTYILNPNPVTIGSNIYDKYVQIKIPSLQDMNNKFINTPSNFISQSLGGLLSQSGNGFFYGAPMVVSVWQVQSTQTFAGYPRYDCIKIGTLSLEQEDQFANIGAIIQESDQGQFFEYFATDNGGFIEDFILFQNSIGNQYYINHQIEVLEQIGAAIIETSRFEQIQTTAYDTPNYYRPIVKNAAYAATFFLRYTMSLVNAVDQSRITRISTYSSNNPAEWGLTITPIQLSNFPQVQKIYNRVYNQPQIKLGGFVAPPPKEIYKFTNVFIQQYQISAVFKNLVFQAGALTDNASSTISNPTSTITALSSGNLTISISPFDNYYKFQFLRQGLDGNPASIDLSTSGNYNMSFLDDQGKKIYIPALLDPTIARSSVGELAFKVDESTSVKLLSLTDRRFFIVNGGQTTAGATGTNLIGVAQNTDFISGNPQRTTDILSSSITTTNNVPVNSSLPASVVYWGFWKKDGEITQVAQPEPIPAATEPAVIPAATGPTGPVINILDEIVIIRPKKPIIKSVPPAAPSGGGCFVAGTLITLWDGSIIPIEDVCIGDTIRSFNLSENVFEPGNILNLINVFHDTLIKLTLSDQTEITSSLTHPYWSSSKKCWVSYKPESTFEIHGIESELICVGDVLMNSNSGENIEVTVDNIEVINTDEDVLTYNFEVSGNHCYFANGILVHNKVAPEPPNNDRPASTRPQTRRSYIGEGDDSTGSGFNPA